MKNIQKTIYLIRHGKSEDSEHKRFQSPHTPLSATGILEANVLANRLKSIQFDLFISSTMTRAKNTSEIVSDKINKEFEPSNLFTECIKPKFVDGKSYLDEEADILWRQWGNALYFSDEKIEEGESFKELSERADKALSFLENKNEETILIISHGFFYKNNFSKNSFWRCFQWKIFKKFSRSFKNEQYQHYNTKL